MVLLSTKYLSVNLIFKRMFMHHIFVTFAPTVLLMIVTQLTLFVDYEEHFEGTIMVHLTTMLVMYTLYASVSAGMPNTAYLKFIDIFILYGLALPFITFVVEVVVKILKHYETTNSKKKHLEHNVQMEKKNYRKFKINERVRMIQVASQDCNEIPNFKINKIDGTPDGKPQITLAELIMKTVRISLPIITITFIVLYSILVFFLFRN